MADLQKPYASRGGLKLAAALDQFKVDVAGFTCADLGSNVGGFTDCLLKCGADMVYAVDTGYGNLDWKLRCDERVAVLERTNALHFDPASLNNFSGCDLVTIDLGWTRQRHAVDAGLQWLARNPQARIITLIKPHYEAERSLLERGVLPDEVARQVFEKVLKSMEQLGVVVEEHMLSPVRGGAGKGRAGNIEYLAMLKPVRDWSGGG